MKSLIKKLIEWIMRILYHPRKWARINYGMLYNWYAVTDVRNIAPAGWHVPTKAEFETLITYLGGDAVAGGKLKEDGTYHWATPNIGATNEVGFNAIGSGIRIYTIGFTIINTVCILSSSTEWGVDDEWCLRLYNSTTTAVINNVWKKNGVAIRLIKDDSTNTGTMVGNDGKIYHTVTIGTQVWMSANLTETKYRNGDTIPEVTDNSAWAALTTGALCVYNNDWNNV